MDYEAVDDWPEHKRGIESFALDHLESLIPGIGEKIVVSTSASARTSWRFTLEPTGRHAGLGDVARAARRRAARHRDAHPEPLLVGHWTRPGGGITPVIVSAQQVAAAVVQGTREAAAPPADRAAALRGG